MTYHHLLTKKTNILYPLIIIFTFSITAVWSDEFSITKNSTVIGQNYGDPFSVFKHGDTRINSLDFIVETVFFAKNLELIGFKDSTGINGETFIGSVLPMRFRYQPHRDVTLECGAVLGQNFGDKNSLDIIEPLTRIVYTPKKDLFIIGGTILPTHWIHDALHDDIQIFRANTEQGFQLRVDKDSFKQDTWINWRIREDKNQAEEFEVGSTTQMRFLNNSLWIDGQLFWAHIGGQKNTSNQVLNNRTLLGSVSYGMSVNTMLAPIKEVRMGASYLQSYNELHSPDNGHGIELSIRCDTYPSDNMLIRIFGSHFKGSQYSSWRGDPLYQFNKYSQIGCTSLYTHPSGMSLEASVVGQYAENLFNYTFMLNLIWGKTFKLQTK